LDRGEWNRGVRKRKINSETFFGRWLLLLLVLTMKSPGVDNTRTGRRPHIYPAGWLTNAVDCSEGRWGVDQYNYNRKVKHRKVENGMCVGVVVDGVVNNSGRAVNRIKAVTHLLIGDEVSGLRREQKVRGGGNSGETHNSRKLCCCSFC
jgi:hypothetical protein